MIIRNDRRSPLGKLAALALVAGTVVLARTAPARPEDDDDRQEIRSQARQSFVENCLMCHGEEMTTRQRLTPKQWATEVEKMVAWGTPLPPERKQPLIEYLSETYSNSQPLPPLERIEPDRALAIDRQDPPSALDRADPAKGRALFATYCAVCHGEMARGGELGTNLVEKPVLLRDDEYRTLMRDGRRRMPGFAAVIDEAGQSDLLAWLRRAR